MDLVVWAELIQADHISRRSETRGLDWRFICRAAVSWPGGLSIDRWRFWKKGFASVVAGAGGEKEGFGEECVRVSAKSAEIMESLEESMTF